MAAERGCANEETRVRSKCVQTANWPSEDVDKIAKEKTGIMAEMPMTWVMVGATGIEPVTPTMST
jgi:hypothetical protein